MRIAPFAYGHQGRLLTSTHNDEVLCCGADDEAPLFTHRLASTVVGVRHVEGGVLALDDNGELSFLRLDGTVKWSVSTSVNAIALAASDGGTWAVIHAQGAIHGAGDQTRGAWDEREVVAGAFAQGDKRFALVTASGELIEGPLEGQKTRVQLGAAANGVGWSKLGYWLVSAADGVHRQRPEEAEALRFLKWGGEDCPQGVCASADGKLCAFRSGDKHVVLFGVERDINCGAVVYFDREVGELEFGPGNWMGVGLGLGDGNKIDVLSGAVHRTDPPPERERNRWMVQVGLDFDEVRGILGVPNPAAPQDLSALRDDTPQMSKAMKFLVWSSLGLAGIFVVRMLLALM